MPRERDKSWEVGCAACDVSDSGRGRDPIFGEYYSCIRCNQEIGLLRRFRSSARLHMPAVRVALSHTTASRYAAIAQRLLYGQLEQTHGDSAPGPHSGRGFPMKNPQSR
jgi:hypothetical protein